MERQNALMITNSGDKALLNMHQLVVNLMELGTVKICYTGICL